MKDFYIYVYKWYWFIVSFSVKFLLAFGIRIMLTVQNELENSIIYFLKEFVENIFLNIFPALHYLPESAQTHVHWVSDAIHNWNYQGLQVFFMKSCLFVFFNTFIEL